MEAMLALFRRNYGDSDVGQEAYFRWQYEGNPAGAAHIWLAEDPDSGALAGQYVVIPMRLCLDGEDRAGCLSLNTLTDERYRGLGIFTGLARALFATLPDLGVALTYGFPNQNSHPGFVQKLEFRDVGQVPLMVKPLRIRALARRRFGPALGTVMGIGADALRTVLWRRITLGRETGIRVASPDAPGHEFDEFWREQRLRYRVMVVRDARYLLWRYSQCPTRRYVLLAATQGDRLMGYLVGRVADLFGVTAGLVVDLFVAANTAGGAAARRLLAVWEDRCVREGAEVLAALMLPHAPEARALRACGYWKVPVRFLPQPVPVIVREHHPTTPRLELRDWFLTFGDYDAV